MITSISSFNVGTVLYDVEDLDKQWTNDDLMLLQSRKLIDEILPKKVIDGRKCIEYFNQVLKLTKSIVSDRARQVVMVAVADAFGGYIEAVMLPYVKGAYYEGHATFDVTNDLHALARKIKSVIYNTLLCIILKCKNSTHQNVYHSFFVRPQSRYSGFLS